MTAREQMKELRRQIKSEVAKIRYMTTRPPRKNPVFEAAAKAFLPSQFDLRHTEVTLLCVDGKTLSLSAIARCYGFTRQRAFQLSQQYGREILAYPLELREALKAGPQLLANRLDKPGECRRIQREIVRLTKLPAKRKSPTKTAQ